MILGPCHGMDWSRRPGSSEIPTVADDYDDQLESDSKSFIVVHGAGWHFSLILYYLVTYGMFYCFFLVIYFISFPIVLSG